MLFFGIKKSPIQHELGAACNVAKGWIKDVDELRSRILTAWDELDKRVIDTAARQWRTLLRTYVKASDTLNTN